MPNSDFLYDNLLTNADREDAQTHLYSQDFSPGNNYTIHHYGTYISIRHSTNPVGAKPNFPVKCHISFSPNANIKEGWNTIFPILLKYPELTQSLKIVNINRTLVKTQNAILAAKQKLEIAKKIKNPAEKEFVIQELKITQSYFEKESKRLFECIPVTFYLQMEEKTGKPDTNGIKKMMNEVAEALRKKGFKGGHTAESDFAVNDFVSTRVDRDKNGYYVDLPRLYMPQYWDYFKDHPTIRDLADEKAWQATRRPEFKPVPYPIRASELPDVQYADEIIAVVKTICDLFQSTPEFAKDIPPALFATLRKALSFESLSEKDKLALIIGAGEEGSIFFHEKKFAKPEIFDVPKRKQGWLATFWLSKPETKAINFHDLFRRFFDITANHERIGWKGLLAQLQEISDDLQLVCKHIEKHRSEKKPSRDEEPWFF